MNASRNAQLIITARLISDFGAFLNMVALATYVYVLSDSAISVAIFLASRVAGGIFASLISTAFYRRWAGRLPLIAFDLLRAGVLGLLLILPVAQQALLLPVIAFGLGFGNSMFAIGLNSQLPNLIDREHLLKTNAWITSAASAAMVGGSLVSGLVVAGFGFETVFALNVVTYLLAALFIVPLRFSTPVPSAESTRERGEWSALLQGLRCAPVLAAMLAVAMADTLGSAAHNVGFPIISRLLTPDSASTTLGLMLAVWASGKLIGARIASRLKGSENIHLERRFFFGVLLMSCGFILMFQQQTLYGLLLFSLPAGLGDGFSEVGLMSRLQREPDDLRLPMFSFLTLLQMTGFGVGMLIAAPFYVWWTPGAVVLLFHGMPLTTLLVAKVLALRREQVRRSSPTPAP
ncbi:MULTISPECIES: MFS transporter [unclassified Pseudomonas]|uniref:MFS transporter n=1 Tax=unclassified Pseudomonas TaxID=196821 RepID=UPI002AC9CF62|nr:MULTISPECIES: MFS transporter [unclassified Pseudomonas]MEB0046860.1 MFS transporter [Pseudomonas sp. Dout3]MEB0098664.1 MFS transporter [Pseudomonas sp. DC1.2]WPX59630.1 MFS transporter [Pseudomonas sp. DC1.2]